MENIKKVIINSEIFELNIKENYCSEGGTGDVYRLKTENLDLAVKIYKSDDEVIMLPRKTLEHFINESSKYSRALLTNYLVEDEAYNYNGLAKPYLEGEPKKVEEILWSLSRDEFLDSLYYLLDESILLAQDSKIGICEWEPRNMMFGENINHKLEYGLYMYDDGYYDYFEDDPLDYILKYNDHIFSRFIEGLVVSKIQTLSPENQELSDIFATKMRTEKTGLDYIKKMSKGYGKIDDFMKEHLKYLQKKTF